MIINWIRDSIQKQQPLPCSPRHWTDLLFLADLRLRLALLKCHATRGFIPSFQNAHGRRQWFSPWKVLCQHRLERGPRDLNPRGGHSSFSTIPDTKKALQARTLSTLHTGFSAAPAAQEEGAAVDHHQTYLKPMQPTPSRCVVATALKSQQRVKGFSSLLTIGTSCAYRAPARTWLSNRCGCGPWSWELKTETTSIYSWHLWSL